MSDHMSNQQRFIVFRCLTRAISKELDKEMPMSDCIGVACLPTSADKPGMECNITGWGTLMHSGRFAAYVERNCMEVSLETLQMMRETCFDNYACLIQPFLYQSEPCRVLCSNLGKRGLLLQQK